MFADIFILLYAFIFSLDSILDICFRENVSVSDKCTPFCQFGKYVKYTTPTLILWYLVLF